MSEELARKFHETYERLAPDFGYETREDTKAFDPTTPNGQLMIAVCREVAGELEAQLAEARTRMERLRTSFASILAQRPDREICYEIARKALAATSKS